MAYIVTEPSPRTTSYVRSGRGGAGNIRTSSKSTSSSSSAAHLVPSTSRTSQSNNTGGRFFSGIGGAGNAHSAGERPTLSLDNEIRAAARVNTSVGHTGIGGAGNVFHQKSGRSNSNASVQSDDSDRNSSISSSSSLKGKLWGRVGNAFSRD